MARLERETGEHHTNVRKRKKAEKRKGGEKNRSDGRKKRKIRGSNAV